MATAKKQNISNDTQNQLEGLSRLLSLSRSARHAEKPEDIFFLSVNETHQLIPYDQAVIWLNKGWGKSRIKAISGIANFEQNTPKIVWLSKLSGYLSKELHKDKKDQKSAPLAITAKDMPEELAAGWAEFATSHGLFIPFDLPKLNQSGGFLFFKTTSWNEREIKVLEQACDPYIHAIAFSYMKPKNLGVRSLIKKALWLFILCLLAFIMSIKVPLSIIAPMEVSAKKPWIATSPHDGVVKEIHIQPNQAIKKGELIISLDDTNLRNQVDIARKDLTTKLSELRQARQLSMVNDRTRQADAKMIELEAEQMKSEISFLEERLSQTQIYAESDGIAIFENVHDWKGRPVSVGERILAIANPEQIEIDIFMPSTDAIAIDTERNAELFLNIAPLSPLEAEIQRISYSAQPVPDGSLAYIIKAQITDPTDRPRIGLKGSAKIYGAPVTLFYNLFRKPISYLKRKVTF